MSKSANSPTARLLRTSRLFSLPRSLPQPALDSLSSTGSFRASNSATSPYPAHQTVVTTPASHFRGDWGLKRSLPARGSRGSNVRYIRVSAQDTAEQITNFSSASDHTKTRLKWRELAIPILRKAPQANILTRSQPTSVFDETVDHTNQDLSLRGRYTNDQLEDNTNARKKWKFAGPWLAGLQDGEFEIYLLRAAYARRHEWREFVRARIAERRVPDARRKAAHEGVDREISQNASQDVMIAAEADDLMKSLRDEHASSHNATSSDLTGLIREFFDLPGLALSSEAFLGMGRILAEVESTDGPASAIPSSHPSAGLSYLRTGAYMSNHPLYGPQAHRRPVLARVIRPRTGALGSESHAKLGVAGVVTSDPVSTSYTSSPTVNGSLLENDANSLTHRLDIGIQGGNKIWVHALDATSDEHGRVRLSVSRGDREAIAIRTDSVREIHQSRRGVSPRKPSLLPFGTNKEVVDHTGAL